MLRDIAQSPIDARRLRLKFKQLISALPFSSGVALVLLGVTVLLSWIFGIEFVKTIGEGFASMKTNTALSCIAAGAALIRLNRIAIDRGFDAIVTASGIFLLLVSLLTLAQYIFDMSLGIDELFFRDTTPGPAPGRMSPGTAVMFGAAAVALLLPRTPARVFDARAMLWATVLVMAVAALLGYAINVRALYEIGPYTGIALHTAAGLAILAIGGLAQVWPRQSFEMLFAQNAVAEGVGRYVLAVILVLSAVWLRYVLGEVAGLDLPYITFYPTVILVAGLAGWAAGLLATLLSALIAHIYFVPPFGQFGFSLSGGDWIELVMFSLTGIAISLLADQWHQLYSKTSVARDQLDAQVRERTEALRASEEQSRAISDALPSRSSTPRTGGTLSSIAASACSRDAGGKGC